ncbi:hypothetical protein ACUXST_000688 [Sphingomonas sp. F9_3S_D5_B_2]
MSAMGERVAVMSLGHSCQTARQIEGNLDLLRSLTGDETLAKASLPFDWLISSAEGLSGMIRDRSFFPEDHTGFVADQDRLRLRAHDVLYWHVSRHLSKPGYRLFGDFQSKFRYTSSRFEKMGKLDRVVAVLSDTQPNLPWKEKNWKLRLTDTSVEEADGLRGTFEELVGRPVDLLMVSRNPKPERALPDRMAYYEMEPEKDGWAGNGKKWAAVFSEYFASA